MQKNATDGATIREIAGVQIDAVVARYGPLAVFSGTRDGAGRTVVTRGGDVERVRAFLRASTARARVVHPALAPIERVARHGASALRITECPEGQILEQRIAHGPMSPSALLVVARRLAAALKEAHRRGVVLGGVRPQNVILTPPGPVLVDRVPAEARLDISDPFRAPEQLGLPRPDDGRSDVYALGVLLWSCATGVVPAAADGIRELVARWRKDAEEIPRSLRALIVEMMSAEPSARPLAVAGLLERVEALERSVIAGMTDYSVPEMFGGAGPVGSFDPPLVGREHVLAALSRHLQGVRAGVATAVLLQGESGIGKSHLVRAFVDRARSLGAGILFARGRSGAREPYAVIRRLIGGFVEAMDRDARRRDPAGDADAVVRALVREAAGEYAPVLAEFGDELAALLGREDDPKPKRSRGGDLDELAGGDTLLHGALARFIGELAAICPAAVACIDDAHWLDDASARVLRRFALELGKQPILLLLTASTEGASRLAAALASARVHVISLDPLPAGDAAALVHERLGRAADPRVVAGIVARCGGSPLALIEHTRALIDDDALSITDGEWRQSVGGGARVTVSAPLALVSRLVAHLGDDARALLAACACVNLSLEAGSIATALERSSVEVSRALEAALRGGALEFRCGESGAPRLEFSHGLLRAVLMRDLDDDARRRLHSRVCRALARGDVATSTSISTSVSTSISTSTSIYALASHSERAGDEALQRTFQLNLLAGRAAAACHAYEAARRFLLVAERAASRSDEAASLDGEFYLLVAIVNARVGRVDAALAGGRAALARTPPGLARAVVRSVLAALHNGRHDFETALTHVQAALRDAGGRPLRGRGRGWVNAMTSLARVELRRRRARARSAPQPERARRARLLARLLADVVAAGYVDVDSGRMFEAVTRGRALCDSLPVCGERAVLLMYYACAVAGFGQARAFDEDARAAVAIAEQLEDRGLWARVVSYRGIGAELLGRIPEAESSLRAALEVGEYWLSPLLYANAAMALAWLLDVRGYVVEAREWAALAYTRGQTDQMVVPLRLPQIAGFLASTEASGGRFQQAEAALERTRGATRGELEARLSAASRIGAALRICVERGELGERFEELAARYHEAVPTPHMVTPRERAGFVSIARGRLLLAMRRRAGGALERRELASLRAAVRQLERVAMTTSMRALHQCLDAGLLWLSGRADEALAGLAAVESYAARVDSPRAQIDVFWLRGHILAERGALAAARDEARRGHALADELGLQSRVQLLEREFELVEISSRVGSAETVAATRSRGVVPAALRLRRHFDTLIQVSLSAARTRSREQQARALLDDLIAILGAGRAFFWLSEDPEDQDDARAIVVGRGAEGESVDEPPAGARELVERVRAEGGAMIAALDSEDKLTASSGGGRAHTRSLMATPVGFGARVLGYLCLEGAPGRGGFTRVDLQILQAIAHHVALATTAARIIRSEHAIAAARRETSEAIEHAASALGLAVVAVTSDGELAQLDSAAEALASSWPSARAWWRALVVGADPRWIGLGDGRSHTFIATITPGPAGAEDERAIFEVTFTGAIRRLVGHGACQVVTVVDRGDRHARGEQLRERIRELEDASARARAASRAKSQFLAYVGEQLRGPLAAISSAEDGLSQIRDAGRQLGALIERILEVSELEAGQLTLMLEPLELASFVDRVARALDPVLGRAELSLVVDLRVSEPIISDAVYLEHVLRDLLVSAASNNQGGELVMEVWSEGQLHDATCVFAIAGSRTFVSDESLVPFEPGEALASLPPLVSESLEHAVTRHLCELLGGALEVHAPAAERDARVFIVRLPVRPARAWCQSSLAS